MWRGSLDESLWNNGIKLNQTSPVLNKTLKKTSNTLNVFRLGTLQADEKNLNREVILQIH